VGGFIGERYAASDVRHVCQCQTPGGDSKESPLAE
jgi:hypothetical protein